MHAKSFKPDNDLRLFCNAEARNSVQVDEDGGYTGVTQGLNERGFLLVKADSGMKTVLSGGVRKI